MAKFLRSFRKNRKQWLAVLTILTVLSFVFIPTIMDLIPTRGGPKDPFVVTTAGYGNLREHDLSMLLWRRRTLTGFLYQLQRLAQLQGGRSLMHWEQIFAAIGPASEEAVVDTWLLTQRAREMGLRISDAAVNEFLAALTEGKVDAGEIKGILRNQRLSQPLLFEILKDELSAIRLRQMLDLSLDGITPAQRWDYFQRLRRTARIEAVPIPVAESARDVADPPEKELKAFFEEHKKRLPNPNSPEPGFRKPHLVDVEYFRAEAKSFVDLRAVTDEAIQAYYDQSKDFLFREKEFELSPEKAPDSGAKKGSEPGKGIEGASKTAPPKAESGKTLVPKQVPPKQNPATQEPAKAALPKSEPPKGDAEKGKPADAGAPKASSATPQRSTSFRLVSYQEKKAAPKSDQAAPKTDQAAPKTPPPPKHIPLEKVKEQIRESLARQKAEGKVKDVLAQVQDRMVQFQTRWMAWDSLDDETKKSEPEPSPLDLKSIADEHRLRAYRTGAISQFDAPQLDIGKSKVGGIAFVDYVFEKLLLYQPVMAVDENDNHYLFWKVWDSPEREPDWSEQETRDLVLRKWKELQARDLARKEAEDLAATARSSGKPLKELVAKRPGRTVITPEPFAWVTYGMIPGVWTRQPPRLSEVKGIDGAGNQFMESVFSLPQGGIGLAENDPRTVVYVVRVVEYKPMESTLSEAFFVSPWFTYGAVAGLDEALSAQTWRSQIHTQAGLHWEREAARLRASAEID